jgi:hypothetical protein
MWRLTAIAIMCVGCGQAIDDDGDPILAEPGEGIRHDAIVWIEGIPVELEVEELAEDIYVIDGDTIVDPQDVLILDGNEQPLAAVREPRLWPNGIIYYKFSSGLPAVMRDRALDAMAAWERRTSLRFREAEPGREGFVKIAYHDKSWCSSTIGYTGNKQYMFLNEACPVGIVKHEFGHTIGLYHEQARTDRPGHVRVLWDNIKDGFASQFKSYVQRGLNGRDVGPYNIDSIMHYGSYTFSRNGRPTMVRASDGEPFGGYRRRIHDLDAAGVDKIYLQ